MDFDTQVEAKVVVLGNTGVGKTCLVLRYVEGKFFDQKSSTIGASFMVKKLVLENTRVQLQIWDTAGQERFRSMAPMYYRGASAAILVFDISKRDSFAVMKDWVLELQSNLSSDLVVGIACNKSDLAAADPATRQVSFDVAAEYARTIGALCYETSAKTNKGVDELFQQVAKRLLAQVKERKLGAGGASTRVPLPAQTQRRLDAPEPQKSKCC